MQYYHRLDRAIHGLGGCYAMITLGVMLLGAVAGMFGVSLGPAIVYPHTSAQALAGILRSSTILAQSGAFGNGVYVSAFANPTLATLMGAAARACALEISTAGLMVLPTLVPGSFRIVGNVRLQSIISILRY